MPSESNSDSVGNPSRQRLIALALLIAASVIVGQTFRQQTRPVQTFRPSAPPVFQSKSAESWIDLLDSPNRAARRAAQRTLRGGGAAAAPVLGYVLRCETEAVRQQAEQMLSAIGPPAAPVVIALLQDENPLVRVHAARLLASLAPTATDTAAVAPLTAALDDSETRVVVEAAYALANFREQAAPAVAALSKCLRHGHPLARATAAEALAAIGQDASSAAADLLVALDDTDASVRRAAVQAIGCIGPPASQAAIDRLIELLADDQAPYVRMAAATALGLLGPTAQSAMTALQAVRGDSTVGAEAAWALANILGEETMPARRTLRAAAPRSLAPTRLAETSPSSWPMLAGRPDRNAVVASQLATDWDVEREEQVLWQVPLGGVNFAGPTVANNRVFIGTDNGLKRNPEQADRQGILAVFAADDGTFLWQDTAPYIDDRGLSLTLQEYTTSTPLVEGSRVYYVTAQAQIRCLDVEGFADGVNDGPWTSEPNHGKHDADLIWEVDMGIDLGVYPHEAPNASLVSVGDLLMVCTSNGVDVTHTGRPAPHAPSFLGVDKQTGEVVWQVVGPSPQVLHGQWSSPSVGQMGERTIVFFGGGDGWLYALDPFTGRELWRYDGNPKQSIWRPASDSGQVALRNNIIACPVFQQGAVFLAMGQDPSHGTGAGRLHKIRCHGRGDVTSTHAAWINRDVRRTVASPIIHDGLVYVGDNYGLVHCLDADTGEQLWVHDQLGRIWGCMLLAGNLLYVGDEDGNLVIYRCGRAKHIVNEIEMPAALYAMPAVVEQTLFLATTKRLYAIKPQESASGNHE